MWRDVGLPYQICDLRAWSTVLRRIAAGHPTVWVRERLRTRLGVLGVKWREVAAAECADAGMELHNEALAAALAGGQREFTLEELAALKQGSQRRESFVRAGGSYWQPHEADTDCEPIPHQVVLELGRRVTHMAYSRIWETVQAAEEVFAAENGGASVDAECFARLRNDPELLRTIAANAAAYEATYLGDLCDNMCLSWAKYDLEKRDTLTHELAVWDTFVRAQPEPPGPGFQQAFRAWRAKYAPALHRGHTMALAARVVDETGPETRRESIIAEMRSRMRERVLANLPYEMPAAGCASLQGADFRDTRARIAVHGLEYSSLFTVVDFFVRAQPTRQCTGADLQQRLRVCPIGGGVGTPTCACGEKFTPRAPYLEHCSFDCAHAAALDRDRLAGVFTPAAREPKDHVLLRKALVFLLHKDTFEDRDRPLKAHTVLVGITRFLAGAVK